MKIRNYGIYIHNEGGGGGGGGEGVGEGNVLIVKTNFFNSK